MTPPNDTRRCPACKGDAVHESRNGQRLFCADCGHAWARPADGDAAVASLRIFLSYGRDQSMPEVDQLRQDLTDRGHEIWFDAERIQGGAEWEHGIEAGIAWCDKFLLVMTPHAVRRRDPRVAGSRDGYCLNEIAKAIERNKLIVPVLLEAVPEGPPTSICRIQYLDMTDCRPWPARSSRYQMKLERLFRALETEDLDFEGGQSRLMRALKPLDFRVEMARHIARFSGRAWLMRKIDGWLEADTGSRVFWLAGGPGVGKTAIATHLCHRRPDVIAYHLCVSGHDDKSDARRALLSLAYQVTTHSPEYARRVQALDLDAVQGRGVRTLFEDLFVAPLAAKDFPSPPTPWLVVIDALDEATRGRRNELAEVLAAGWAHLPPWMRLFITSRPEPEVLRGLDHLRPLHTLLPEEAENLADVRGWLKAELDRLGLDAPPTVLDSLMHRSGGLFLYAIVVAAELEQGRLRLDQLDRFPDGMAGYYQQFFERRFPDEPSFESEARPVLEAIVAAQEPLPVEMLADAVGVRVYGLVQRLERLGTLFPIREVREGAGTAEVVAPFHKSILDWLTDRDPRTGYPRAGRFGIARDEGEQRLIRTALAQYDMGPRGMSGYALAHLPAHLMTASRWADAARVLADFEYLMARCRRNDTRTLVRDLDAVWRGAPAAIGRSLRIWEAFFRERAHILARGDERWPADRILLQLAVEHGDDSPLTAAAEAWLAAGHCDWTWLRRALRPTHAAPQACVRVIAGHQGPVIAVELLADGSVVSASRDRTLRRWNPRTGDILQAVVDVGDDYPFNSLGLVRLSGDRFLVGARDRPLRVWNAPTGELSPPLDIGAAEGLRVAYTSRDRFYVWKYDYVIQGWSASPVRRERMFRGHTSYVSGVLEIAGNVLVSWSADHTLKVWDIDRASLLHTLMGHSDSVIGARQVSGDRLVSWSKTEIRIWSTRTWALLHVLTDHDDVIDDVLEVDGRLVTWQRWRNPELSVWNLDSGVLLHRLRSHTDGVIHVYRLRSGQIVSTSEDRTLRVWDAANNNLVCVMLGHEGSPYSPRETVDGRLVSCSMDGTIRFWDPTSGRELKRLVGHAGDVNGTLDLPSGELFSWSEDGTLRVWDVSDADASDSLPRHHGYVSGTVVRDGRQLVTWATDGTVQMWNEETGERTRVLSGHTKGISGGLTLSNGWLLTWADDGTLRSWDLTHGSSTVMPHGGHWQEGGAELANNRLVSSTLFSVKIWDLPAGTLRHTLIDSNEQWVLGVLVLRDGRVVTRERDGKLRVWDPVTGRVLLTLPGHPGGVYGALELPGGHLLSWAGQIHQWDLATGALIGTFHTHAFHAPVSLGDGVRDLGDGRLLCWREGQIQIWDIHSKQCVRQMIPPRKCVLRAAVDARGQVLVWSYDNDSQCYFLSTFDPTTGDLLETHDSADVPWKRPEWLAVTQPNHAHGEAVAWAWESSAGISAAGATSSVQALWQGDGRAAVHGLHPDGTVDVTLAGGDVCILKLYRGGRRIGLAALSPPHAGS